MASTTQVILLGYRGSGKTTVGRLLAQRLGWGFVDTDDLVRERFAGAAIAQIWQRHGEAAFRQTEVQAAVEACTTRRQTVIALGGGTIMQPLAREIVAVRPARETLRVYLAAPAEVLWRRIHGDQVGAAQRPALTGQGGGLAEVEAVLARREAVYREAADLVLDVSGLTPQAAAQRIWEALARAADASPGTPI